ncbi:MAG: hypothetical protein ACPGPS_22315, partial [Rubripirellula sp.]
MKRIVTHMSLFAASAILATGCVPVRHNLPPEQRMIEAGPGVGGPGPGVLGGPVAAPVSQGQAAAAPQPMSVVSDDVAPSTVGDGEIGLVNYMHADAPLAGEGVAAPVAPPTLQVTFGNPDGMQVRYDATGGGGFDSE